MRGEAAERKGVIREERTDKHGPESRDERGETTEEEKTRGGRGTGGLKRKKICMKVRGERWRRG